MIKTTPSHTLAEALAQLKDGAAERDRTGVGLGAALAILECAEVLAWNATAGTLRPSAAEELDLIRSVARADGSVGRVLDGHFNGVERLAVQAPPELAEAELGLVRAGLLRVGVWGGDPRPGEGQPAQIECDGSACDAPEFLTGAKTFCSGAGTLDRALVLARDRSSELSEPGPPALVWVDLRDSETVTIDEDWYRTSGLRASASHRVVFERAPILARFGPPGAISAQPWFGRDALRTAASWAGMADRAVDAALRDLASRPGRGQLEEHAAGRLLAAQRTVGVWLDAAARAMDEGAADLAEVALHGRVAIAQAIRQILEDAARACGSHPFATGGDLDRVRRDLELFLLQHRLDPGLARVGASALDAVRLNAAAVASGGSNGRER